MRALLGGALRAWRRRDVEGEVDEELAFHFERTVDELTASGLTASAARAEAVRRFGDVPEYRRMLASLDRSAESRRRTLVWAAEFADDVRYALRCIRRSRGFAAAVVLTFALGIGANATMYGIIDRILLSPPAHIAESESVKRLLVGRYVPWAAQRVVSDAMTYLDVQDLATAGAFTSVAAYSPHQVIVGTGTGSERLPGLMVTGSYFGLLGVRARVGRLLGPADDVAGGAPVAVISHGLWQRRFGADASVVGRRIDFGSYGATIVGVAPAGFTGVDLDRVDVWQPVMTAAPRIFEEDDWLMTRGWHLFRAVARVADVGTPAIAAEQATAAYRTGREAAAVDGASDPDARIIVASLIRARGPDAPAEATVAGWVGGVSLLLLVIVCANIANLLLARAFRRRRENAVRLALGISRGRLFRQVTLEGLILALLGGGTALVVAVSVGAALRRVLFPDVTWTDPATTGRVVLFTAITALLAGGLTGAVPAVQALRTGMLAELKSAGGRSTGQRSGMREGLIVFQAALSVVLLVGAGLFVRSLDQVANLDLGFEPDGVTTIEPVFDGGVTDDEQRAFFRRAEVALEGIPGVTGATSAASAPFWGRRMGYDLRIPGVDSIPALSTGAPTLNPVAADYFEVLQQRVLRGRGLTQSDDRPGAEPVALVNETMAQAIPWPGGDPIGNCMRLGSSEDRPCIRIVGITGNARAVGVIEDETMQYYVAIGSGVVPMPPSALLVRSALPAGQLIESMRRVLHEQESGLRFANMRPMSELIDPDVRSWRLGAAMFSVFGALALLVAAVGLYSVLAFAVIQRRQELGIRAALGADRRRLVVMVLRDALRVTLPGIAIGLAAAALAAPYVRNLLYEVAPRDPLVLASVAIAMLLAAMIAGVLPAAQAGRVDPQTALRAE